MIKAKNEDINPILKYLEPDLQSCLYIYIDITNYGISSEHLDVWYEKNEADEFVFILLRYHNAFQIYSHLDTISEDTVQEVLALYREMNIEAIHGKKTLIQHFEPYLADTHRFVYGWVFLTETLRYKTTGYEHLVELATADDAVEIAELMCSDPHWSKSYSVDALSEQLRERISNKTGRSYVIRQDGRIVVHNSTFAETDKLVIMSGMMVHKDYRDTMLGPTLETHLARIMDEEGKALYFIITDPIRKKLSLRFGSTIVQDCGKCIKQKA